MERFWQVTEQGVVPIMLDREQVISDPNWCNSQYKNMTIFENFSRAQICWFERFDANKSVAKHAIEVYSFILDKNTEYTGEQFASEIRKYYDCEENVRNAICALAVELCVEKIIVSYSGISARLRQFKYPEC